MNNRMLLGLAIALLFGCTTGPIKTKGSAPTTFYWTVTNEKTRKMQVVSPAGIVRVNVALGDDYAVVYHTASASGIKSITFGGSGKVICANDPQEKGQFSYTIAAQTIDLTALPGNQAYTQAFFPYFFLWAQGPAQSKYKACGNNVPLLGTTTYTASSVSFSGTPSGTTGVAVAANPP